MWPIENKKDMKIVGRAIRGRWDVNREEVKQALLNCINSGDPDLIPDACKLLLEADKVDLEREKFEHKVENDERRYLLDLAKQLPASELIERARKLGFIGDNSSDAEKDTEGAGGGES